MALKRVALIAILAGAVLVPATTASAGHPRARVRLSAVPLQTAQLGPAGAALPLAYGSGPDENSGFIIISSNGKVSSGGPIRGYSLDYGDPFTGGAGVTEIRTSVKEYPTPAAARTAVEFGGIEEIFAELFGSPFATTTVQKVKVLPVGQRRHGSLTIQAAAGLNPIVKLDEQVAAGRFVLDLTVTAGSVQAAKSVAPHLLLVLHRRLGLMLGGHLTVKPPKLPPEPKVGQAPGGPDLSTLILQPSDLGMSHAVNLIQLYVPGPPALSDFIMELAPAGTYDAVIQQIGWWPTATEATYGETYGGGQYGIPLGFLAAGGTPTPVDLSAVGDSALGLLIHDTENKQWIAVIRLTNGQAGETVAGVSDSVLQASDVQSLAQAAADRLDAGLGP